MDNRIVKISEMPEDKKFEDYPEHTIFVLEDKPRLYDEKKERFLFSGHPDYDALYELLLKEGKNDC